MRFFKKKREMNIKYILGEILLLFVGINLAIWFNNWNSSNQINDDKAVAISRIIEEIDNNVLELDSIMLNNSHILKSFEDYKNFYDGSTAQLRMSPIKYDSLKKIHPKFFRLEDSIAVENGEFRYLGTTYINLEITTLTEIAWQTTTTLNVSHEFSYDCLYELESLYNLQRRVQDEINKSANALQNRELLELMHILEFLEQLGTQLQESYADMVVKIETCS